MTKQQALPLLLLASVAILGMVGGAVMFLGSSSQPEIAPLVSEAPTASPVSSRPESEALEPLDEPQELPDEAAASDGSFGAFLEAIRDEEPLPEDEGRPLRLRVVDAESQLPVAGAMVRVVDGYDGPGLRGADAEHWSTIAEDHGQLFECDAQGEVELPPIQRWAIVSASAENAFGYGRYSRRHRELETIRLLPDETVKVRVVDTADQAVAGVPVGILQAVPERRDTERLRQEREQITARLRGSAREARRGGPRRGDIEARARELQAELQVLAERERQAELDPFPSRDRLRAQRHTDAEGIVVFRHFQVYRQRPADWWPEEKVDRFQAVLLVPLRDPPSAAFQGRPLDESLDLTMPPTGRLTLRTVDRDGRPFVHPVRAELSVAGVDDGAMRRSVRKEQGASEVEFPFVGLGLELSAQCRLDDEDFRWELTGLRGPMASEEPAVLDLVVAPDAGMLHGRLVNEEGQALAGVRPSFLINSVSGRLEGEELTTGPEGRFHLPYLVADSTRGPFELEVRVGEVAPPAGVLEGLSDLPRARVTDLGELRLAEVPLLAEGTVRDDRGEPLRGARVRLQQERLVVRGDREEQSFVDQIYVEVRSDEEGAFALYGQLPEARSRLRVEARDHFPADIALELPGQQHEIELEREARLYGTVLLPDWMRADRLSAVLSSLDRPDERHEASLRDRRGRRYLLIDELRSGRYDLSVRSSQFPDPILELRDLVILPGQRDPHPRLDGVDLRGSFFRFELSAVSDEGGRFEPDQPLVARIRRSGGQEAFVGFRWDDGRLEIAALEPTLEIWPASSRHQSESRVLNHGSHELRFSSSPVFGVQLPGLRALIGSTEARLTLIATDDGGRFPGRLESWDDASRRVARSAGSTRWASASVNGNDVADIRVARSGRYRASLSLGARGRRSRGVQVSLGELDLDLRSGGRGGLVLPLDESAIRNALDQLAQRANGR